MKKLFLINPAFLFLVGMLFFGCQEAVDLNEPTAEKISSNRLYCHGEGCTNTPGYWKNHPEAWPVSSLTLGVNTYNQQQLLDILNQPVRGNGLVKLAQHLIAAELNFAKGASSTPEVDDAIVEAHTLIGQLFIPPGGTGSLRQNEVNSVATIIDDYNNH